MQSPKSRPELTRCSRCLYPSTKPDLYFVDGVCSACLAFDARKTIDWKAKEQQFLELVRSHPGKSHDVIVACSGGKDSTWQIVKCLELGLRPLAVTATTDHLSEIGRKNLDNVSRLCDHVEITPNKTIRNRIARFALEEVGDISWCEHHLIWSVPARESQQRGIPIVLYGEAPQNEMGAGPKGSEKIDRLTDEWVHEYGGLLGLRLEDVIDHCPGVKPSDLEVYRRPAGVAAVFMGQYFEWDGWQNAIVARQNGFTKYGDAHVEGSLFDYENLDNGQTGAHDALRYWKFGYTRAIDIASYQIRRARLTRSAAIDLCRRVEGYVPRSYLGIPLEDILANIGLTVSEFQQIALRFMERKLFEVRDGWPYPKFSLEDLQEVQEGEAA